MNNLFFFWGQEDFLLNSEIDEIKSKNIDKNFEVMAYKKIYKPNFDDLMNAVTALPMMFGNVMHVIDVFDLFFPEGESEIGDWELTQLEKAFENKSEKNIVVLKASIPLDSKKKVDTRKKIYKLISKYAQEKQFPLYRHFDKELPNVIDKLGKNNNIKLSPQVKSLLIEQVGTNLGILNSELSKLAITIYPKTEPTVEDIKNICTQKDDVFIILEAIFKKNFDKALLELKKVMEKSFYLQVMGALQQSLRNFVLIKIYFPKVGKTGVSKKLGIHEYVAELNYKLLSGMDLKSLLKLKSNLLKAEYSIKTGDCINPEEAIELALMGVKDV